MSWFIWVLIILAILFVIGFIIKIVTRNNEDSSPVQSSGGIVDRAKNVGSNFKECCMKIIGKFGGGA